ncbi:hypothetical protein KI387_039614, partial [Taxus chinensis]
ELLKAWEDDDGLALEATVAVGMDGSLVVDGVVELLGVVTKEGEDVMEEGMVEEEVVVVVVAVIVDALTRIRTPFGQYNILHVLKGEGSVGM